MNLLRIIVTLATFACGSYAALDDAKKPPHIIMVVADDLGWDDISFHGSPQIPTPNLDALANSGVILNNYYVSPMDTPSRASFMTGKYPIHMGVQHDTLHNRQPFGVPLTEKFLPEFLREMGYQTHAVGKWQLGFFAKEYTPTYRGFDSFFGFWTSHEDYYNHVANDGGYGIDLRRNLDVVYNETGVYGTELLAREADEVIENHSGDKPLFLYLAHQAVHVGNMDEPLQAPKRHVDKFKYITDERRRTFAGMVSSLDESMRQLVTSLKRKGLYQNSIIIFTTDNGGAAGGLDMSAGSNFPLRGNKNTLWEGGVRGVAFVHSPLIKRPGRVYDGLMHASDWLPTLHLLAGGSPKLLGQIDGYDLWDGISKGTPSPRYEVLHGIDTMQGNRAALRVGDYKVILNQDLKFYSDWYKRPEGEHELDYIRKPRLLSNATVDCTIKSPHPLLYTHAPLCNPQKKPCLFNIKWDPCEYHNLAAFMPNTLKVLLDRLKFYAEGMKPVIYPRADDLANPDRLGGVWTPWKDDPNIPNTEHDYIYPLSYEDQATNASGWIMNKNLRKFMSDQITKKLVFANTSQSNKAADKVQSATNVVSVMSAPPAYVPPTSAPPTQTQVTDTYSTPAQTQVTDTYSTPAQTTETQNYNAPVETTQSPETTVPYNAEMHTTDSYQTTEANDRQSQTTEANTPPSQTTEAYTPPAQTTEANTPPAQTTEANTPPVQTTESYNTPTETTALPYQETSTESSTTAQPTQPPTFAPSIAPTQPPTPKPPTTEPNFDIKVDFGQQQSVANAGGDLLKPVVPSPSNPALPNLGDTFMNTASSTQIQEVSKVEKPFHAMSKVYPFSADQLEKQESKVPEILDIIDESKSAAKQVGETANGQASIPKIFDIIDEMHNNKTTAGVKGPTATSKPLTISDVGSGMGVGLNKLPNGISVFGKLGDKLLNNRPSSIARPTKNYVYPKPTQAADVHRPHTFFGNITIEGRTYFVVGSESDELAMVKTKLVGDKIVVHVPKDAAYETGRGKSRIVNEKHHGYSSMKDYIEDGDDDDDDVTDKKPLVKSLAAHNITTVPYNGANGTKCEKVVQLDTSDNAVVVSSVVIVVIASAMVVGVAVVAMVAVVARHCQNARRES